MTFGIWQIAAAYPAQKSARRERHCFRGQRRRAGVVTDSRVGIPRPERNLRAHFALPDCCDGPEAIRARRGQHITREYGVDPYELSRVREVMVHEVDVLQADLTIPEAVAVLRKGRHRIYPVVDASGRPTGLVSRADALRRKIKGGHENERLGEHVSDASLAVVHPGDVVVQAVDLMLATDQGRLPVCDSAWKKDPV